MISMALLYVPLVVAGILTFLSFFLEVDMKWRIVCVIAVGAAAFMRFVPGIEFPFLIPFLLESAVALGLAVWLRIAYK